MANYIICDIDGTIAESKERVEAFLSEEKDWEQFYENSTNDKPVDDIIGILQACTVGHFVAGVPVEIVFITGRPEKYRGITMQWLSEQRLIDRLVLMRADGDFRPDHVVKRELFEKNFGPKDNILFVLEDRTSCVKMWRDLGLTCLQVRDGDY